MQSLIFHMEVGNCCKGDCLLEEINRRIVDIISMRIEHVLRYLADCDLTKECIYVTDSPTEVLNNNLAETGASFPCSSMV